MSLPPGFLDEIRNRVPISRVIGRRVVWDQRKSNQARGDWWAPCPFHQEKSASFHCDDQKGFYYCFGCQAKGDVISFLRECDGMEFIEAVKSLASEAGLSMPEPDPRAREKSDRRSRLIEVTEAACRWFRLQLQTGAAAEARDYLARRGLDRESEAQFEIGFAPGHRTALTSALRDKGFEEALIVEAGMAAKPVDGGPAYDRFRGRIVFPIRDGQGRCIGFGGRAMDPNARAKYLNSPETPLFDKGRNLYNLGPARAAVGKGQPLIVAEGYMDVIALSRAGFQGAVAPLGTAITSEQLAAMWRLSPEPVIALDGDAAGQRAAQRLIDLALPLTGPGQALRFVLLPAGQDPDDLIRVAGQGAMKALLDQARPLVDLLWSRETEGQRFDSPERKAALDRRLQQAIARIPDELTRRHYADEIRGKRWQLFGGRRQPRGEGVRQGAAGRGPARRGGASMAPRAPLPTLPVAGPDAGTALLEGASLLICALRPELVALVETRLERLSPRDADRAALLHDLLTGNESEAGRRALEILRSDAQLGLTPPVIGRKDPEAILTMLQNLLDRIEAERAAGPELSRAETEIEGDADEGLTWRFQQVNKARHRAERPELEDSGDLNEDRDKLAAELSDALSRQIWRKPPRR
ncbi:MAG: DNA primase [Paracoccus sp. (in: a-proteobacteria)]|uniref:DNA primase n=1 Tax=unclassified Paracoccus (in: a-proteobacteria) TaxID=2688777 RepID=UPI000C619CEA|nr:MULTISPECIES: DNA primase [unclassified Paracoccus (in: a-proteobacteria)]MAN55067.1 DNA primase [Paracoccus sp. (in: a-proteobacteria)]MBA50173.1 DNA primase [Paracoccus sp. (in: a-proteobacteria)]|tara:strand:+ start:334 stop:2250 length:1917 start_codon:yes stop_codon:yes gene_type:complete